MRKVLLLSAVIVSVAAAGFIIYDVRAGSLERVGSIRDPAVTKECGACHMTFQPQFLPKSSWVEIMNNLDNHFGEDASLTRVQRDRISGYLVSHAPERGEKVLRITELKWWKREHGHEVSKKQWKRAGTPSNCKACHRGAEKGFYE